MRGAAVFGGLRMQQTFEHLLGLPAESALAILRASGITGVQVKATAAPPRRASSPADALRTPEGEAQGYASTRVVAVEDDGRTLIVSRLFNGHAPGKEPVMTAPLYAEIDLNRLPRHVAIIMDGNGRWAKQHKVKVALGAPHRHRNAARDHPFLQRYRD